MRIDVISFTVRGAALSLKVAEIFGKETGLYHKGEAVLPESGINRVEEPLSEWTKRRFSEHIPVIFIGALGIAVRSIAPVIDDKLRDIPVVVIDEGGGFSIPVLSSHYGGGLHIAKRAAEGLGATCVITTATDINGIFAVDVFASKNNLIPANKDGIKKISSRLLQGDEVSIYFDKLKSEDEMPKNLKLTDHKDIADVVVSNHTPTRSCILHLIPRNLHLGVGCKRGKSRDEILAAIREALKFQELCIDAVEDISTIDLKGDEEGLIEAAAELDVPLLTYSADKLNEAAGDFTASELVFQVTGVDNVCERAAVLSAGAEGELIIRKYVSDGVTVAAAQSQYDIRFT